MIKAVIFDIDNTLMDFMRMKRASVDAAADAMIDAGLSMPKQELVEKIFKIYWAEGIEDQSIFDKVLTKEFGQIDYKILAAGIIGYKRAKAGHMTLYPHVNMTLTGLPADKLKASLPFMTENMQVEGLYLNGVFFNIQLPANLIMEITETVDSVRGDTVSNTLKAAKVSTGLEIKVPMFIKEGDKVRVDTRTMAYVERYTEPKNK